MWQRLAMNVSALEGCTRLLIIPYLDKMWEFSVRLHASDFPFACVLQAHEIQWNGMEVL